jgi:hypothetical protein
MFERGSFFAGSMPATAKRLSISSAALNPFPLPVRLMKFDFILSSQVD